MLVADASSSGGLADPVVDAGARLLLNDLKTAIAAVAKEATLAAIKTVLDSLNAKDFATQTTLAALNTKDFATQTTLAATKSGIDALNAKNYSTEATLSQLLSVANDTKRAVTDYRQLIEWNADGNPVYVGLNAQSAATSATTWVVRRITWDASGNPTDLQVLTGAWTQRSSLAWTQ